MNEQKTESKGMDGWHQQLRPYSINAKKLRELSKAGSWSG